MGACASHQRDINDAHPNIFSVSNVDDHGNRLSKGHLEVTEDCLLVYHQRGKEAVRWPLKSLRRYGAERKTFSFESGRKCQTGPGIYTFRTARAEVLLGLVHDKIRSGNLTSGNDANRTSSAVGGANSQRLASTATAETFAASGESAAPPTHQSIDSLTRQISTEPSLAPRERGATVGSRVLSLEAANASATAGDYANVNCNGGPLIAPQSSADGYLVPNTPVRLQFSNSDDVFESATAAREYENVGPVGDASNAVGVTNSINGASVLPPTNLDEVPDVLPPPVPTTAPTNDALPPSEIESPQINYIAVDFDTASGASPASPLSSKPLMPPASPERQQQSELKGAYCTIDIDRTKALSTTAKQQSQRTLDPAAAAAASDSPVGVRKTRHNSTLQELTGGLTAAPAAVVGMAKRNSIVD